MGMMQLTCISQGEGGGGELYIDLWASWLLCTVKKMVLDLRNEKKKKKFSGPALFSTSPVSRRKRTVCHGIHLEEQEDLLVCNYIIMLILFSTFSITRSPRYQAGFISIIAFHGVTYRIWNTAYAWDDGLAGSELPVSSLSLNLTFVGSLVKAKQLELSVLKRRVWSLKSRWPIDLNRSKVTLMAD